MALVVFLKGINVGGHRRFKPGELARELSHLDVVNVGAAGTLVVRGTGTHAAVRSTLKARLPFEADVMICDGGEVVELVASDPFKGRRSSPDVIQFVSILLKGRTPTATLPLTIPGTGPWTVKVLERRGRYLLGEHRREMKAIGCLEQLEQVFGSKATTRGWKTMQKVARVLTACVLLMISAAAAPASPADCVTFPIDEEFKRAGAVFVGRVTETAYLPGTECCHVFSGYATLEVRRYWKGNPRRVVRVGVSGYIFEKGRDYVVFAFPDRGGLSTNSCNSTQLLQNAGKTLDWLRQKPSRGVHEIPR